MTTQSYRISKEKRRGLVRGLGWFSIGLGVLEVFAPRFLARSIGAKSSHGLLRLFGLREIGTGIGILTRRNPANWIRARVAGDAMDLTFLAVSFTSPDADPARLAVATGAAAGVTALDFLACKDLKEGPGMHGLRWREDKGVVHFSKSIIISRQPDELYSIWHRFEDLPKFMGHLISVQPIGEKRQHWIAKGPAKSRIEWDSETTEDRPGQVIAWQSAGNSDVESWGRVRFEKAPGNRGTILHVEMRYRPPAGRAGAKIAKFLGQSPEKQISVDLLRFRQLVETGEIARTEGQPAGRRSSTSKIFDDLVRA